jgi:large subunit ribosomal protein L17
MRHGRKINHLSRKSAHRKAMLQNMATSLILHKRIHTTLAKAKALRTYIEPLLTKSKDDTTNSRRVVFSELQSKEAVTELFREVSVKIADRPGGYTRIIKIGNRLGDNAELCMMELVDFNENLLGDNQGKAKPTRKRRGTGKKKADDTTETVKATPKKEEKVEEESKPEAAEETPEVKAEADAPAEDQTTENINEESK